MSLLLNYIQPIIFQIKAAYRMRRAIHSHFWMALSLVVNINARLATTKNGIPICNALSETVSVVKNEGSHTTASELKVLEPNMFPNAIECFPAMAARTDIISSGKLVPIATASMVIIDGEILSNSPS